MANQPRPYASNLRHTLAGSSQSSAGHSSALVARINEKKAELEDLKQLRDHSETLAAQMEALEQKLSTLSDGTQAVATVLANWENVLRAINMASAHVPKPRKASKDTEDAGAVESENSEANVALPQTLIRMPAETD